MDAPVLIQIARRVADGLYGPHERLRVQLLRLLALGRPVSLETLAAQLGWPIEAVAAVMSGCPDIEFDDVGRIIGWGLTLKPTAHQFRLVGATLYTWCALDTLMYPAILERSADVASSCPVTGKAVQLRVCLDGVVNLDPAETVVSIVLPDQAPCSCSRATFCAHGHYFASRDAAEVWQASAPRSLVIPVATAYKLAHQIASERLRRATLLAAPGSERRSEGAPCEESPPSA